MNGRSRSKILLLIAVLLVVLEAAACAFVRPGFALTAICDLVDALLLVVAFVAFVMEAAGTRGRMRSFWLLQAAGCALWFGNQATWVTYDLILQKKMPQMSVFDSLLFLAGAPMFAGLLLRPHRRPSERSARVGALDFSLLALWWLYLYIAFVVCWQYISPNDGFYNRNYDWLSAAGSALLVVVACIFCFSSSGRWKAFYAAIGGIFLFNGVAFYLVNNAIERNAYFIGSWYDIAYSVSFALFTAMVVMGRGLSPLDQIEGDEAYGSWSYASWMANLAMAGVLSLPVIAFYALLDRNLPFHVAEFRVLLTLVAMFVMAFLLFIRHHFMNRELRDANAVLQEASLTDPLTGLRNRRYFSATIEADVSQALRAHADAQDARTRDLVFYLVDADNFKEVNDRYGHDVGDKVLVEMSHRLSTSIRHSDVLVRWGGEEFLIVSRYTDRRDAELLAHRVLFAVAEAPFAVGKSGESIYRTCSLGWAAFPWIECDPRAISYDEVLALADRGLHQAKHSGKNCAVGMIHVAEELPSASIRTLQHKGLQVNLLPVAGPRSQA